MIESVLRLFTRQFVLLSGFGMFALALSLMLVTGLPLYLQDQGWTPGAMGGVLGTYFLSALFVRPFAGRESDRRGRKVVLVLAAVLLLLPCPFYLVSTSLWFVLVLRVVQGAGWAMSTVSTATILSEIVPAGRVGTGMGVFGVINGLAFTFGPALGTHLLRVGGPRLFFGAAVVLALLVLFCGLAMTFPAATREAHSGSWGEAMPLVKRLARPLLVTAAVSLGYGAVQTFLPLYAKDSGVLNPGYFFTAFSILLFVSRPTMGRLSDHWGRPQTAALLMLVIASTFGLLAYSASLPFLISAGLLYGIGHGAIYTVLMALLADITPKSMRGLTYGIFGTAIDLGITSGNFLFGATVPTLGYQWSFMMASVLVIVVVPLLYKQPSRAGELAPSGTENG